MNENLKEIFLYFLKLGLTGFGGPVALAATMQTDLVEHRRWISRERFQTSFSLIKAMPGPIAFSAAVYLGRIRGGFLGGLIAGVFLIFPAFLMMIGFGILMYEASGLTWIQPVLTSLQIPALAVIVASLKPLIQGFEKSLTFWLLFTLGVPLCLVGGSWEPLIILCFGLLSIFIGAPAARASVSVLAFFLPTTAKSDELPALFGVFFKAGAFVFGSGLAIIPMLEADVVTQHHWLTPDEFLNAVALGQITPGPVMITSTLIGYKVLGLLGATVATIAVFLSSFIHMTTWFPKAVGYLSQKTWIPFFTRGALAAVLASLLVAVAKLSLHVEWSALSVGVFILLFVVAYKKWLPAWATIPVGCILLMIPRMF